MSNGTQTKHFAKKQKRRSQADREFIGMRVKSQAWPTGVEYSPPVAPPRQPKQGFLSRIKSAFKSSRGK